jgi:CubicO group peptidase (beta-lactamase class C family)
MGWHSAASQSAIDRRPIRHRQRHEGATVLVVASLVEEGGLDLATTARSVLGEDLPLIDDGVTVEHLLAHPSGIGDYFDEEVVESMTDYVLPGPVHRLVATDDYLAVLDGHHQQFAPGERFAYNNGGFVVLALIAERVSGTPFAELVWARVCEAAGMRDTAFLRSDEPAERVALGYLAGDGLRTNVLHLPVCGSGDGDGDGGIYSTASDVSALWAAMYAGRIGSCRGSGLRTWCDHAATCPWSPLAAGWGSGCARCNGRAGWARYDAAGVRVQRGLDAAGADKRHT